METKKIYLVKSLSPWMIDELLAFSKETSFTLWLFRKPSEQYQKGLDSLEERGIEVIIKPFKFSPDLSRIVFVIRFILTYFSKLTAGYSAVIGWKSIYWFLRLDANIVKEELSIHAQFATQSALMALLIKKYKKESVKYHFTFHAYDIFFNNKWFSALVNSSEKAFSISEYNKTYVINKFNQVNKEKLSLSRLGALSSQKTFFRKESSIFRVGFLGRLVEKKGLVYLLKAMEMLQAEQCKVHLSIAGDGPLVSQIKDFILKADLKNIGLVGQLHGSAKDDFYQNLDVFVMPSVQLSNDMDGIPVVMMEAIAHKLPLIASNISGLPEICVDDLNGILVPPANATALAEAIKNLYNNHEKCIRLSEQSAQIFQKFSLQVNSDNKLKAMRWLN